MTAIEFHTAVLMQQEQLKRTALRLTRDHWEAEDLLQETVYKAFAKRDTFTDGTSLHAWLYTIMRNTFLSDRKREKIRQRILDPSGLPVHTPPQARTENHGHHRMLRQQLEAALQALRPEHREPFLLYHQGFKYREIAEQMDISTANVKIRIHLARKFLRERLRDYQYGL